MPAEPDPSSGLSALCLTGRCYCGTTRLRADKSPDTVAWCHCDDCRRATGSPAAAFAAFAEQSVTFSPDPGPPFRPSEAVERWFCKTCGSPLAARYDYLPGQIYVPVGILDDPGAFAPQMHCHAGQALPWVRLDDGLARHQTSGRDALTICTPRTPK